MNVRPRVGLIAILGPRLGPLAFAEPAAFPLPPNGREGPGLEKSAHIMTGLNEFMQGITQ